MKKELELLKEKALKATPGEWYLEHDDMYVGVDTPGDNDWWWVTGSMDRPSDGYNCETTDADMRGPKEVVQKNNQFISAANPQTILKLIECIEGLMGALQNECHAEEHKWGGLDCCPPCRAAFDWERKFGLDKEEDLKATQ